jgi:hypothetical protein
VPDITQIIQDHLGPIAKRVDDIADQLSADAAVRGAIRGIKPMRIALPVSGQPSTVALPPPDPGYSWNLKILSATLTAADSVVAYIAGHPSEVPNNRIIGKGGPPGAAPDQNIVVIMFGSDAGLLNPGEGIVLATSGTGKFTGAMVVAVQTPAEMIGKILS